MDNKLRFGNGQREQNIGADNDAYCDLHFERGGSISANIPPMELLCIVSASNAFLLDP